MNALLIVSFLLGTAFAYWIIFLDGAEGRTDTEKFLLFGLDSFILSSTELKFSVAIGWIVSLVFLLMHFFG